MKLTGFEYNFDLTVAYFASSIQKVNRLLHQPRDAQVDPVDVRMNVPGQAELWVRTRAPTLDQIETLIDAATTWFRGAHNPGVHEDDPYEMPENIFLVLRA